MVFAFCDSSITPVSMMYASQIRNYIVFIKAVKYQMSNLALNLVKTKPLEQAQVCNCSGSGGFFYHKVAPAPELLDITAPAPLVKNLTSSMFVQFEVSSF